MARVKEQGVATKNRKPRSTFDEVVRAAKAVERRTKTRASEAAVRKELNGGSSTFVCRVLNEWRASKKFDGLRKPGASEVPAKISQSGRLDGPHPELPEGGSRPPSGQVGGGVAAIPKPARGTADVTLEALAARIDKLEALLQRQGVDVRLLGSDVQELGRRVDTLSDVAVTGLRQPASARADAVKADVAESDPSRSGDVTTEPRPRAPSVDAPGRAKVPADPDDDSAKRKKVRLAVFHCVAKLAEIGSPMSCKQLHHSLPKDVWVGTSAELYRHLKGRASRGETIRYAGGRSGAFVAGPGAAAFLDEHTRTPVVHLTETQVARSENEVIFLAALELLEAAGGGPLAVKDFVDALSGGTREGVRRVKDQLKNCHYRRRRDDRGRGIGRIKVGDDEGGTEDGPTYLHVLTRDGVA